MKDLLAAALLMCSPWAAASELHYENLTVVIDDEVIIAPASIHVGAANMVFGPDGTIWINSTTTDPGLYRSTDNGETWTPRAIKLPNAPGEQYIAGLSATRHRRLWIIHQEPPKGRGLIYSHDAFVSVSEDRGKTWRTKRLDFASFAPNAPEDPYATIEIAWCHPNVIERPDGTVMFSASMRYEDWDAYQQTDQTRPGLRDVMIRTTDGGRTWGDPTVVHQHATETAYAVDPFNPDHVLAATRIQRKALPGEDPVEVLKTTGVPYPPDSYIYKNGLLLESADGGRMFKEVPGGLMDFGAYRFCMLWNRHNVIVITGLGGQKPGEEFFDNDHVARISLDGGRTWADGTSDGTPALGKAKKFSLVPVYRDVGKLDHYSNALPATVQLSSGSYLTLCRYKRDKILKGRIWHLENRGEQ